MPTLFSFESLQFIKKITAQCKTWIISNPNKITITTVSNEIYYSSKFVDCNIKQTAETISNELVTRTDDF